ncbi:hypothetical protein C4577_05245 [Candidatus Parcubacteria bacterium]|nr:MAG: hypothetical protein C4577_05245 [Candidatus Parcubacteria bacterium]
MGWAPHSPRPRLGLRDEEEVQDAAVNLRADDSQADLQLGVHPVLEVLEAAFGRQAGTLPDLDAVSGLLEGVRREVDPVRLGAGLRPVGRTLVGVRLHDRLGHRSGRSGRHEVVDRHLHSRRRLEHRRAATRHDFVGPLLLGVDVLITVDVNQFLRRHDTDSYRKRENLSGGNARR